LIKLKITRLAPNFEEPLLLYKHTLANPADSPNPPKSTLYCISLYLLSYSSHTHTHTHTNINTRTLTNVHLHACTNTHAPVPCTQ